MSNVRLIVKHVNRKLLNVIRFPSYKVNVVFYLTVWIRSKPKRLSTSLMLRADDFTSAIKVKSVSPS